MIWLGVPIFDWVILVVVLGLGIEAYLTTRLTKEEREALAQEKARKSEPDALSNRRKSR